MRLADSLPGSNLYGEDPISEVLAVLYEVFGDTLEFHLSLSCNSDWEHLFLKFYVTESSDEEDDIYEESNLPN